MLVEKKSQKQRKGKKDRSTKKIRNQNDVYSIQDGSILIKDPLPDSTVGETRQMRIEREDALRNVQEGGSVSSYNGVKLDESGNMSDKIFKQQIVSILEQHHIGDIFAIKSKGNK